MKKNLITLLTVAAMLSSTSAVFADTIPATEIVPAQDIMNKPAEPDTPFEDIIQGDVMLISERVNVISPSYISNSVTVTEVTDEKISTTTDEKDAENPEKTINYTVSDNTIVLGYAKGDVKEIKDIKKGDKITVYSNAYAPAPLILPPQYQADVIFVQDNLEISSLRFADVDTYVKGEDEMFVNLSNTLALNLADDTEIVDREGKKVDAKELDKKDLAVIYTSSTKSIPAQTTPVKVVVLGENEMALKALESANTEATPAPEATPEVTPEVTDAPVDYTTVQNITVGETVITNVYKENDTLMVPLREIAEKLGFTVEWDGELKAVMLNSGMYSLKIGENAYGKGKMMPQPLKAAPVIKDDDLTYVPVEYFTELLESNDSIVLNYENAE
ncbi:MAG: hypothetical protein HFE51_08865 [Clostridia bacterium]|nr:hypothetical protein [Clostridia bacterium]MCI9086510.1 hypothetical protein [Clostridia bacterium]